MSRVVGGRSWSAGAGRATRLSRRPSGSFRSWRSNGFDVDVHEDLDAYDDEDLLAASDLVLQCCTQGEITDEQVPSGSAARWRQAPGSPGWHGGIVDSFRMSPD